MKSHYKKFISKKRIQAIKEKRKFNITLLDALHYLQQAWEAVSEQTIRNCFRKAGFVHDYLDNTIDEIDEGPQDDEPMLEEEFEEHEDNDLPTCAADAAKLNYDKDCEIESESESENENESKVTGEEAYKSLCTLKKYLAQNDSERYNLIHDLEDELHFTTMNAKHQAKITDFFKI